MGGKTSNRIQESFCALPEKSSFRSAGHSWLPADSPQYLSKFFRIRPFNSKIYTYLKERRAHFNKFFYLVAPGYHATIVVTEDQCRSIPKGNSKQALAGHVEVQPVGHVNGTIRRVRSVQHQGVRRHLQAFDCTGITQDRHDHLLVCRFQGTVHHDNIPCINAHPNHSISCYPQKKLVDGCTIRRSWALSEGSTHSAAGEGKPVGGYCGTSIV